jgi:predicted HTH transcriptional regulator
MTENNRTEYKRELTDNLEKEVVAFLNYRDGGLIYLGIDEEGRVHGVNNCDQLQLAIKDRLRNNIQPSIMGLFDIIHEQRDSKEIIRITVAGGQEKPYYLKKYGMTEKGCFIRVGSASEPMPQEMIDSLYSRRIRNTIGRMESTRQNLTFEQLKIYYEAKGLHLNSAFMQNLELLTPEGKPNYAAYLLADENGVSIQVAKYADATRINLIENRDFGRCSLVKALKGVMERMDVENTIYTRIGYPLREEREMLHGKAMREAVINAIVHNDYSNGACPKFEFFSDRLEITSAGGLPYGVTEEDFFNGYSSPRNKEIMRVFRDLEIVEQLGSGIPRILEKYGRDAFEIRPNFLRVIFRYDQPFDEQIADTGAQSEAQSEAQSRSQSASILSALLNAPLSAAELAMALGLESKTGAFKRAIKELLEKQLIEYTLPGKPNSRLQKYRLTNAGHTQLHALKNEK